jgi:hypothetical protein
LSGVHFEWAFHGRPRSSSAVELHFEKASKEQNQYLIAACGELKGCLDTETGEAVTVQKEWGKTWARMYIEKQSGQMTDELKVWAVNNMLKFIKILQPELDKMKKR